MSWVSDCSIRVSQSFVTRHRPISVGAIVPSHISITHGYTTVNVSWLKHTNPTHPMGVLCVTKSAHPEGTMKSVAWSCWYFILCSFHWGQWLEAEDVTEVIGCQDGMLQNVLEYSWLLAVKQVMYDGSSVSLCGLVHGLWTSLRSHQVNKSSDTQG